MCKTMKTVYHKNKKERNLPTFSQSSPPIVCEGVCQIATALAPASRKG